MKNLNEDTITQAVLARHCEASDPRLRDVMTCLVQHLPSFAREIKLTEDEWFAGVEFLTAVGHITDDKRQEFILLSDVLGLSMLVTALNNRKPRGCTEATVLGPFHVEGAPSYAQDSDISNGASGEPFFVCGRVLSLDGSPVPGAELQVWQADAEGMYDVQYPGDAGHRARGVLHADADGRFSFKTVRPASYPIPHDGPVGHLLKALGRHPWRPAHLHFLVSAPGHQRLITHLFRNGDTYLDSDAVFGVRGSLVCEWLRHPPGRMPDGATSTSPYYSLSFDFVLNPLATASSR